MDAQKRTALFQGLKWPSILDYLIKNTSTKEVRLVVEKQNTKAIHLYEKLDFNALDKKISEGVSFIVMTKTLVA